MQGISKVLSKRKILTFVVILTIALFGFAIGEEIVTKRYYLGYEFWRTLFYGSIFTYIIYRTFTDGISLKELFCDFRNKLNIYEIIKIILYSMFLGVGIVLLATSLLFFYDSSIFYEGIREPAGDKPVVMFAIGTVLFAPVVEEVLFRGIYLNKIREKRGIRKAVIISSMVFGMLHGEGAINATMFAVMISILYINTKNILFPMLAHSLNNTIPWIIDYFLLSGIDDTSDVTLVSSKMMYGLSVSGLIILIISFVLIYGYIKKNWPEKSKMECCDI